MFEHHVPEGAEDGAPVAVLLHGRGSHRGDLQALRDRLPDGTVLVTPQAPHPGHPWGYGPGWAWYRHLGEDRLEPATLDISLQALHHFLLQLPAVLPVVPGPIVLGGFSQGGTTSLAYGLKHASRVAGVLVFSGFLPGNGAASVDGARGTRVFWAHGTRDPNIPHSLAVRGRDALVEAGAQVRAEDYETGHWIAPEALRDASDWMGDVTAGSG